MEEEAGPELISPRISFSHDLVVVATAPPDAAVAGWRSDASLLVSRSRLLPEPEFDFANAAADDDVAPADRLFAGGKLLPMPPLPPAPKPTPCNKPQACSSSSRVKAQQAACHQQIRRAGSSWASPFSRSSSVNSATTTTTTTTGAPRSAGRFGCPPFPLMRSWSVGSAARDGAAAALGGGAAVSDAAGGHRPRHHHQYYKKLGGAGAATTNGAGGSRAYYYGGSRKGSGSSSSHGVRVHPVLNVPFIGTSVSNVLSYLLCDCSSHSTKKSREF